MVSYRCLLITVLHLQQTHLINLFSLNSKSEFGMLKRSISIYKFVFSTVPSSCYKINQNKFIVCVYTLFTSAGIFIDKQKAISSCGWNYCNIVCTAPRQLRHTIKTQILMAASTDSSPDNVTWKEEKKLTELH